MPAIPTKKSVLNPEAQEFYPSYYYGEEEYLSYEELEELEATETWLDLMADLEELEQNHCVELALLLAEPSDVKAIEARVKAS